ncbi:hypothetical protein D9M68_829430 [compost metagenome]
MRLQVNGYGGIPMSLRVRKIATEILSLISCAFQHQRLKMRNPILSAPQTSIAQRMPGYVKRHAITSNTTFCSARM